MTRSIDDFVQRADTGEHGLRPTEQLVASRLPVQMNGQSQVWQDTLAELDSHRLDLAILPIGALPSRYAERFLFEEDFVVAMRKGHPLARALSLTSYVKAQHLPVSAIGDPLGIVDIRLAEQGHSRRVALTVPNFTMALAQLAESDLIATLPRHLVEQHATRFHLVARPMPFRWTADSVRVVTSQAAMADAGIAWLFEVLTSCISRAFGDPFYGQASHIALTLKL